MRAVVTACQEDTDGTVESFRILDKEGDEITAEDWLPYCARQGGTSIDVWVRVLSTEPQLPDPDSELALVKTSPPRWMGDDESLHESAKEQTDQPPAAPSNTGVSNALIVYDKKGPVADKLPPNRVPRFLLQPQAPIIMNFTFPDLKLDDLVYRHPTAVERQPERSEGEGDYHPSKDSGSAPNISVKGSDGRADGRSDDRSDIRSDNRSDERSDGTSDGSSDSSGAPRVPPFFLWPIDTVSGRRNATQERTINFNDRADDAADHTSSKIMERREEAEGEQLTKQQEKDLKTILKDIDIAFQKAKFDDLEYSRSRKFLAKLYKEEGESGEVENFEEKYPKMSELHEPIPYDKLPPEGCPWQRALVEIFNRWDFITMSFCPEEMTDDTVIKKLLHSMARFFKVISLQHCMYCAGRFTD